MESLGKGEKLLWLSRNNFQLKNWQMLSLGMNNYPQEPCTLANTRDLFSKLWLHLAGFSSPSCIVQAGTTICCYFPRQCRSDRASKIWST